MIALSTLILACVQVGCGDSGPGLVDMGAEDGGTDSATTDLGSDDGVAVDEGVPDAGPTDAGRMCVPTCTQDIECQNSCPASTANANCCDMLLGICYAAVTPTCPSPLDPDGGMMMY